MDEQTLSLIDLVSQVGINVFGVSAILLVSRKNRWGFVSGILAQPFWFATITINHQWSLFFINIIYALSWSYGIYENFFKTKQKPPS